ncbi:MAG: response regulator [Candidatus Anammoxibacter sp.]
MKNVLLIIESDKKETHGFISMLEGKDYSVETAISCDEALSKIKIKPSQYRLCILDADFSSGLTEGLDVCKRLKSDETTKRVPIILMTCRGGLESIMTALGAMADMFLVKPFDNDHLLMRIKLIISDFEARRCMKRVVDLALIEYLLSLKEDIGIEKYLFSLSRVFNLTVWNKLMSVVDFVQLRVIFESTKNELRCKHRFINNIFLSEDGIKIEDLPSHINESSRDKTVDVFAYFVYHFLNIVTVFSGKIEADMNFLKEYDRKMQEDTINDSIY